MTECAQLQDPYSSAEGVKRAIFMPLTGESSARPKTRAKWADLCGFVRAARCGARLQDRTGAYRNGGAKHKFRGSARRRACAPSIGYAGRALTFNPPSRMILAPL